MSMLTRDPSSGSLHQLEKQCNQTNDKRQSYQLPQRRGQTPLCTNQLKSSMLQSPDHMSQLRKHTISAQKLTQGRNLSGKPQIKIQNTDDFEPASQVSCFSAKPGQIYHAATTKASHKKLNFAVIKKLNKTKVQDSTLDPQLYQTYTDSHFQEKQSSEGLHEGIQYLQQNLKQLEGKYQNLANYYVQQEPPPSSSRDNLPIQNFALQVESSFVKNKEACFQIRHLSEQLNLDLKRCQTQTSDQDQVKHCLQSCILKISRQNQYFDQIEQFQHTFNQELQQFQQNQPIQTTLKNLESLKECHDNQLESMEKSMQELRSQNSDLQKQLDNQMLRETTPSQQSQQSLQQVTQKIQVAQTTREQSSMLEGLASSTTKFLNAMRRLQKVVHKKEPDVQSERIQFETTKKDVEQMLKQIQIQLSSGQKVTEIISGRVSSTGEITSEIPHRLITVNKAKQQISRQSTQQPHQHLIEQIKTQFTQIQNQQFDLCYKQELQLISSSQRLSQLAIKQKDRKCYLSQLICVYIVLKSIKYLKNKLQISQQLLTQRNKEIQEFNTLEETTDKQVKQLQDKLNKQIQNDNLTTSKYECTLQDQQAILQQCEQLKQKLEMNQITYLKCSQENECLKQECDVMQKIDLQLQSKITDLEGQQQSLLVQSQQLREALLAELENKLQQEHLIAINLAREQLEKYFIKQLQQSEVKNEKKCQAMQDKFNSCQRYLTESSQQVEQLLEQTETYQLQLQFQQTLEQNKEQLIQDLKNENKLKIQQLETQLQGTQNDQQLQKQLQNQASDHEELYQQKKQLALQFGQSQIANTSEITKLQTQLVSYQLKLKTQNEQLDSTQVQLILANEQLDSSKSQLEQLNQQLDSSKEQLVSTSDNYENTTLQLTELQSQQTGQEQLIQKLKQQLQKSLIDKKEIKDQFTDLQTTKLDLESQTNMLSQFVLEGQSDYQGLESEYRKLYIWASNCQVQSEKSAVKVFELQRQIQQVKLQLKKVKQIVNQEITEVEKQCNSVIGQLITLLLQRQEQLDLQLKQQSGLSSDQNQLLIQQLNKQITSLQDSLAANIQMSNQQEQNKQIEFDNHLEQLQQQNGKQIIEMQLKIQNLTIDKQSIKIESENQLSATQQLFENKLQKQLDQELKLKEQQIQKLQTEIENLEKQLVEQEKQFDLDQESSLSQSQLSINSLQIELSSSLSQLQGGEDQTTDLMKVHKDKEQHYLLQLSEWDKINSQLISILLSILSGQVPINSDLIDLAQLVKLQSDQTQKQHSLEIQQLKQELKVNSNQTQNSQDQLQSLEIQLQKQKQDNKQLLTVIEQQLIQLEQFQNQSQNSSQQSQDQSLLIENKQLLTRLQKTEIQLKQLREQPQQQIPTHFEQKLAQLSAQLQSKELEIYSELQQRIKQELTKVKHAYQEDKILNYNLSTDSMLESFNDQLDLICRVSYQGDVLLMVKSSVQIYVINEKLLSHEQLVYLQQYNQEGVIINDDQQLKSLIGELSDELQELRTEYDQWRSSNQSNQSNLQEDFEYLQTENHELQIKSKQLCLQNALLKASQLLQLQQIQTLSQQSQSQQSQQSEQQVIIQELDDIQEILDDDDDGIQAASNILEESLNKEQHLFESSEEHDSIQLIISDLSSPTQLLQQQLSQAKSQIKQLEARVSQRLSLLSSGSNNNDNGEDLIAHIKGTLIQYLKQTPFTDRQNEELLKIICSMMKFTPYEQTDLAAARMVLKGSNKQVFDAFKLSQSSLSQSSSTNNNNKSQDNTEKDKNKKGLFSIFTKSTQQQQSTSTAAQDVTGKIQQPQLKAKQQK